MARNKTGPKGPERSWGVPSLLGPAGFSRRDDITSLLQAPSRPVAENIFAWTKRRGFAHENQLIAILKGSFEINRFADLVSGWGQHVFLGGGSEKEKRGMLRAFFELMDAHADLNRKIGLCDGLGSFHGFDDRERDDLIAKEFPPWMRKWFRQLIAADPKKYRPEEVTAMHEIYWRCLMGHGGPEGPQFLKKKHNTVDQLAPLQEQGDFGTAVGKIDSFVTALHVASESQLSEDPNRVAAGFQHMFRMLREDDRITLGRITDLIDAYADLVKASNPEGDREYTSRGLFFTEVVLALADVAMIKLGRQRKDLDPIRLKKWTLCRISSKISPTYRAMADRRQYEKTPERHENFETIDIGGSSEATAALTLDKREALLRRNGHLMCYDMGEAAEAMRRIRKDKWQREDPVYRRVDDEVSGHLKGELGGISPTAWRAHVEYLLAQSYQDGFLDVFIEHVVPSEAFARRHGPLSAAMLQKVFGFSRRGGSVYFPYTFPMPGGDKDEIIVSIDQRKLYLIRVGDADGYAVRNRTGPDDLCDAERDLEKLAAIQDRCFIFIDKMKRDLGEVTRALEYFALSIEDLPEDLSMQYFEAAADPEGFLKFNMGMYDRAFEGTLDAEWNVRFTMPIDNDVLRLRAETCVLSCLHSRYHIPLKVVINHGGGRTKTVEGTKTADEGDAPADAQTPPETTHRHERALVIDLAKRKGDDVVLSGAEGDGYSVFVPPRWRRLMAHVVLFYTEPLREKLLRALRPNELALLDGMNYLALDESLRGRGQEGGLDGIVTPEERVEIEAVDVLWVARNHLEKALGTAELLAGHHSRMQAVMEQPGMSGRIRLPDLSVIPERLEYPYQGDIENPPEMAIPPRPSSRMTFVRGHMATRRVHLAPGQGRVVLGPEKEMYLGDNSNTQAASLFGSTGKSEWDPYGLPQDFFDHLPQI